ncbi:RNA recognition motif domain-containing protein [Mangrovibacterium lignilyticum]|uniref:RNA recognition motif domain-containing protein n=1 Tax=Mangrovibacterium lignilyticum TaxID=2668052 RepID=UPI0013D72516|nr:RNA-binding protein [Mangrovibacterium lignilyticum]
MNIYVGNLNYNLSEEDVTELFAEFGEVVSVKLVTDRETGRAKGFGFVEMADDQAGAAAVAKLDGADVQGRNIKVNEAKPRENTGGSGRPRRDGGYNRGGGGFGGGDRFQRNQGGGDRGGYGGGRDRDGGRPQRRERY